MMTLNHESPIARARRTQNDEIRMYADLARTYLDRIAGLLDEMQNTGEGEDGNDADTAGT